MSRVLISFLLHEPFKQGILKEKHENIMKIFGHRGCILNNKQFQNYIEAFKLALKYTHGFETDACLSADGDVFFIHEEVQTVDGRITSSLPLYLDEASVQTLQGRILQDISTEELRTFKLQDGQHIPTFEDLCPLFTDTSKIWNIELKAHQVTPVVIEKLKQAFAAGTLKEEQIVLSSFDHTALQQVRQALPQITIGALFVAETDALEPLNPWRKDDNGFYMPLTDENLSRPLMQSLKPDYIIGPHTELTEKQILRIQKHHPKAQFIIWVCGEYHHFDATDFDQKVQKFSAENKLSCIIVDDILRWKTV
jgi:glycerophosphoryl diester phosphodiesterase